MTTGRRRARQHATSMMASALGGALLQAGLRNLPPGTGKCGPTAMVAMTWMVHIVSIAADEPAHPSRRPEWETVMTGFDRRSFLRQAGVMTAATVAVSSGAEVLTRRLAAAAPSAGAATSSDRRSAGTASSRRRSRSTVATPGWRCRPTSSTRCSAASVTRWPTARSPRVRATAWVPSPTGATGYDWCATTRSGSSVPVRRPRKASTWSAARSGGGLRSLPGQLRPGGARGEHDDPVRRSGLPSQRGQGHRLRLQRRHGRQLRRRRAPAARGVDHV